MRLNDEQDAAAYLEFFCDFLRSEGGVFMIAESAAEVPWRGGPDERAAAMIRPARRVKYPFLEFYGYGRAWLFFEILLVTFVLCALLFASPGNVAPKDGPATAAPAEVSRATRSPWRRGITSRCSRCRFGNRGGLHRNG